MSDVLAARTLFPRGLKQSEDGYRFSIDALLLGCFARVGAKAMGVDLGTGCGAVSFAALLRPELESVLITGVDIRSEAVANARENAASLGLSDRFSAVSEDIRTYRENEGRLDFVLANPPYREERVGRVSTGERGVARFEQSGDLDAFAACACRLLKTRGRFFVVYLPERLSDLLTTLAARKLEPKRLCFVHGDAKKTARIVLVEAVKAGKPGLEVEAPLVLYAEDDSLTKQAERFCPYLQCNVRKS